METTLAPPDKPILRTYRCTECGNTTDIHPDEHEEWEKEYFNVNAGYVLCDVEGCRDGVLVEMRAGQYCTMYLNLYGITQGYGGPEEGGWWYEQGTALGSIPLPATWELDDSYVHDAIVLRPRFKAVHREWAENCLNLTAMNDTQNYRIVTESHMASDYPTRRPHYE